jgi:hypothetical protein
LYAHIDILAKSCSFVYDLGRAVSIDLVDLHAACIIQGDDPMGLGEFGIYFSQNEEDLFEDVNCAVRRDDSSPVKRHISDWLFELRDCTARYFGFTVFKANPTDDIIRLSALGLYNRDFTDQARGSEETCGDSCDARDIQVYTKDVITEDFMGLGTNVIPMEFMPESIADGYNEVWWELQKRRVLTAKPHVNRMWFQIDWIVENEADYIAGRFDFESGKMQSVYRWLDILKKAGGEIELNFGWKIGTAIQEWFTFPEVTLKRNAAPRDLKLYGRACALLLRELIVNRGYDNIKYLTFYNESNYFGDSVDRGEFLVPTNDKIGYWIEMLRETDRALGEIGLRGIVKYWNTEVSGPLSDVLKWMSEINRRIPELTDMYTFHRYISVHGGILKDMATELEEIRKAMAGKPFAATEFGCICKPWWQANHIAFFITAANLGVSAMLQWIFSGIRFTDPLNFLMQNFFDFFGFLPKSGTDSVNESFYELCLPMTYIPNHSKTLRSNVSYSDDIRAAAFRTPDGGYTVVIEAKQENFERKIKIDFDEFINKTFYRYTYKRPNYRDPNAVIPPCEKEICIDKTLIDIIGTEYSLTVYTTIPPRKQIAFEELHREVCPGGSAALKTRLIDCDGGIEWSVAASTGSGGSVDENGVFSVSAGAKTGDMFAVRAELEKCPDVYGIAIVTVK